MRMCRRRAVLSVVLTFSTILGVSLVPFAASSAVTAGRASAHVATSSGFVSQATNRGSNSRAGWYGDQTQLTPSLVGNSQGFGQIWKQTAIVGNVYAQPIVANGVLIVATERNNVYGLNPTTGAVEWSTNFGTPLTEQNSWNCSDISPYVGITSTPTYDPSANAVYFVSLQMDVNGQPSYWMHALDPQSGAEEPNFPVEIQGQSSNNPTLAGYFDANNVFQRPGLLLLGNTVYVGFGSHCDVGNWNGMLVGVSTSGTAADSGTGIDTIWDAITSGDVTGDAGIWQSGGGITQYGNNILLTTGNGNTLNQPDSPTPANQWNGSVPSAVVELSASSLSHPDLQVQDFFMPYNEVDLSAADLDFGSGSPVVMPSSFGTTQYPNVILQDSKAGCLYLLNGPTDANPNTLGGYGQGTGGGDAVIGAGSTFNGGIGDKLCNAGGAWSTPAVLPTATGGYVYLPTGTGGSGSLGNAGQGNFYAYQVDATGSKYNFPTMTQVATAGPVAGIGGAPTSIQFGFGSSSPVVTSNQMTPGTGVVWVVRSLDGQGDGGTLQAYNAIPNGKWLTLLGQWSIGKANKFTSPGVWNNTIFVPSLTGAITAFGALTAPTLASATAVNLPVTLLGQSHTMNTSVTTVRAPASGITITGLSASPSSFTAKVIIGGVAGPLPAGGVTLKAGQNLQLAVTFSPPVNGKLGAQLGVVELTHNYGVFDLPVSGSAQSQFGQIYASSKNLDFSGLTIGLTSSALTMKIANYGGTNLTFAATTQDNPTGFTVTGLPKNGFVLTPNTSITISATFSPTLTQTYGDDITFTATPTGGGSTQTANLLLTGSGAAPAQVNVTTPSGKSTISLGTVPIGSSVTSGFTLSNDASLNNGSTATITSFQASHILDPVVGDTRHGDLAIQGTLAAGEELPPQFSSYFPIVFQPSKPGIFTDVWTFVTDEKKPTGTGYVSFTITFTGVGAAGAGYALSPPSPTSGWTSNGSAILSNGNIQLTSVTPSQAGSSFWPTAQSTKNLTVSYTTLASGGTGADSTALVLANAADTSPSALGAPGLDLGINGIDGISVVVSEYTENGSPAGTYAAGGFVGITDGLDKAQDGMNWLATAPLPADPYGLNDGGVQDNPLNVTVTVSTSSSTGAITVSVIVNGQGLVLQGDGSYLPLTADVTNSLGSSVLMGFAGATGGADNQHDISNVWATVAGPLPTINLTPSYSANVGSIPVGGYASDVVTLTNTSSLPATIASATTSGAALSFITTSNGLSGTSFAVPSLPLTLEPGNYVQCIVGVQPATPGAFSGALVLGLLGANSQSIPIKGTATGVASAIPSYLSWHRNGSATLSGSTLQLTNNKLQQAGTAWDTTLLHSATTSVTFRPSVSATSNADGLAVLYGTAKTQSTFVGGYGYDLGFAPNTTGITAVVFSEYKEPGAPGPNFVGVSNGAVGAKLRWIATALLPVPLKSLHGPVTVTTTATSVSVYVNGARVLKATTPISATARLGFSGSTGGLTGAHSISGVVATQA